MARNDGGQYRSVVIALGLVALVAVVAVFAAVTDTLLCYKDVPHGSRHEICDEHVERAYRVLAASAGFMSAALAGMAAILRL
jgi:hypothetical protein